MEKLRPYLLPLVALAVLAALLAARGLIGGGVATPTPGESKRTP